jgi:hypothetical protein
MSICRNKINFDNNEECRSIVFQQKIDVVSVQSLTTNWLDRDHCRETRNSVARFLGKNVSQIRRKIYNGKHGTFSMVAKITSCGGLAGQLAGHLDWN